MASDQNQAAKKPTLATDQKEEQQDLNFISLLPDEILHSIISKLQIRDAAVTTAISKRWAPLFPTLPSLKITAATFNPRDPNFNPIPGKSYVENSYRIKWIDALCSVLRSRKAALKKFHIAVDILEPYADHFYELEISNCWLVVPSKLTGLGSVKSLVLWGVVVADDDFQRMISRCKAMEKLVITDCLKIKNIVIRAPRLSELVISFEWPVRVVLKSVPRLVSVAVSFSYNSDIWNDCYGSFEVEGTDDEESDGGFSEGTNEATNLNAFLNGLRCVKDLHLNFSDEYRMILSKDAMALPTRLSPECYLVELKKLCLCFPFNYNTFSVIISCLLNSSPQLMEIIIGVSTVSEV
ncbi:F-box protein [Carex littledalei]|uniref:F-box protein n=1 Tax=Carex littledalei TaxID=544730 RepID=A0A833RJ54_9POAL|nr:F-box protein [Carex littledalei]